jgi:hypothetical protein
MCEFFFVLTWARQTIILLVEGVRRYKVTSDAPYDDTFISIELTGNVIVLLEQHLTDQKLV